jgi:hypothetical protein
MIGYKERDEIPTGDYKVAMLTKGARKGCGLAMLPIICHW